MNRWIGTGRFTKDPDVRYNQDFAIANFTLAVNRRFKREGDPEADFIPVTCFGKIAEIVEKYFRKGMKADIEGRIQTGSYQNKDGKTVYTWGIIADVIEFGESKKSRQSETNGNTQKPAETNSDPLAGFMSIPDGIDEELPFK